MLKTILTVLLGVLSAALAFAQSDWTNYYEDAAASIDYKYQDCHRPEDGIFKQEIHLRLSNLTQSAVTISYQKKTAYNGKPAPEPGPENTFTVTLRPGEVLEGDCLLKNKGLYIFVKMLDGTSKSVLTAFDLVNIKVSQK